jgi:hypothetical protein
MLAPKPKLTPPTTVTLVPVAAERRELLPVLREGPPGPEPEGEEEGPRVVRKNKNSNQNQSRNKNKNKNQFVLGLWRETKRRREWWWWRKM